VGKFAVVSTILLMLGSATRAQDPVPQLPTGQDPGRRVFRSEASVVALNVTVTDGDKLITGLNAEDFEVYEDNVRQEVSFFESADVPMDLILLLDTSSSMRDRMPVVHDAAKGFMKILRAGDRGAIVAFDDKVRVIETLTADGVAIEAAIGSTRARGSTSLNDAVYIALKQFGRSARSRGEVRRQALVLLSDGQDTSSLISLQDVVAVARRVGVSIYAIGLQSESRSRRPNQEVQFTDAAYALKTLARETGARTFFPANEHQLKEVYESISKELEAQYSIGYTPSDVRADGRFRRVTVRVPANPSFRPRTRLGYTADATLASNDMSSRLR
jgi:Ca-activated chloride channel family protein